MMWSTSVSGKVHTKFTPNSHRIEPECFNNNNSITMLKYNVHRQFGEKVRRDRLNLKYVESEYRDM